MDDIRQAVRVRITGKVIKVLASSWCTRKYLHHLRSPDDMWISRTRKMLSQAQDLSTIRKGGYPLNSLIYLLLFGKQEIESRKNFHIVTTSDRLNYSANIVFRTNFMHFHLTLFRFSLSLCRFDATMRCSGVRRANAVKDNKRWNARSPNHHHISFYRNP